MDLKQCLSVKELITNHSFYFLMLNCGLPLDEYCLSEMFIKQVPTGGTSAVYVNDQWTMHQHGTSMLLISRLDPLKVYILLPQFWIATDLGGDAETPTTWTIRIDMYTKGPVLEAFSESLRADRALLNFQYNQSLVAQFPIEWARLMVKHYFDGLSSAEFEFPLTMNQDAVSEIIWTMRENSWWKKQIQNKISSNTVDMKKYMLEWKALYNEAKEEIKANTSFEAKKQQMMAEEEDHK